jgi:uncharacterized protein (TIRG00374 family)
VLVGGRTFRSPTNTLVENAIESATSHRRRTIIRWATRGILLVVLVVVVWFVLIPQWAEVRPALQSLPRVSTPLLLIGLGLELTSIACYTALSLSTLAKTSRPGYFTMLRIDVATNGVSNAVPGGGPTSTALKYRLLTLSGTTPENAVTGTTLEIATSVLTLGGLFGLAIAGSMGVVHGNFEYYVAAVVVGGVALLVTIAAVLLGKSRKQTLERVERIARRIPFLPEGATVEFVDRIADQLREYQSSKRRLVIAVAWAMTNWLLDAAALWVFLLAFGFTANPWRMLVAYALACLVGLLPITPGGLGIIEGVLVPTLVGFGTPQGIALLGVLTWRLVQYWLPLPLAGLAYLSLRAGPLRRSRRTVATAGANL